MASLYKRNKSFFGLVSSFFSCFLSFQTKGERKKEKQKLFWVWPYDVFLNEKENPFCVLIISSPSTMGAFLFSIFINKCQRFLLFPFLGFRLLKLVSNRVTFFLSNLRQKYRRFLQNPFWVLIISPSSPMGSQKYKKFLLSAIFSCVSVLVHVADGRNLLHKLDKRQESQGRPSNNGGLQRRRRRARLLRGRQLLRQRGLIIRITPIVLERPTPPPPSLQSGGERPRPRRGRLQELPHVFHGAQTGGRLPQMRRPAPPLRPLWTCKCLSINTLPSPSPIIFPPFSSLHCGLGNSLLMEMRQMDLWLHSCFSFFFSCLFSEGLFWAPWNWLREVNDSRKKE